MNILLIKHFFIGFMVSDSVRIWLLSPIDNSLYFHNSYSSLFIYISQCRYMSTKYLITVLFRSSVIGNNISYIFEVFYYNRWFFIDF